MSQHAIGIDLGTTYSCVAVYRKGKVDIFENESSSRTTPSYVAFTEHERLIGHEAKQYISEDPSNTVFEAKRLIGRKYNDQDVQSDMKQWPFTVLDDNGDPVVEVEYLGETKEYKPQQISAMILEKLKELAEEKIGETVTRAVITVPAYFNDSQRQATKDAAQIAGLHVLQLINEPTAAAIAFCHKKSGEGKKNILVYDLGGGTFDVSVLTVDDGGSIEVKAVNGDTHLGGSDFDQKIVEHFLAEIKRNDGRDLSTDEHKRARLRLRHACEVAKRSLSSRHQATINIDSLYDKKDFISKISRATFDDLCDEKIRYTLKPVEEALADAGLAKNEIDEIVLVGGSTKILKVQSVLQEFFDGKPLNRSINPDEAVAYGAAIQAAVLRGDKDEAIAGVNLKDVTPLSYGTDLIGGLMDILIPRNTPYPTEKTEDYVNGYDNQVSMLFQVLQGERTQSTENKLISEFELQLPPRPRATVLVRVKYEIDINGTLHVSATETQSGTTKKVTVTNIKGRLSEKEIEQMIKEAERLRLEDERVKARIVAKNMLENLAFQLRTLLKKDKLAGNEQKKEALKRRVEETLLWVSGNPVARQEEYEKKARELQAQKDLLNL